MTLILTVFFFVRIFNSFAYEIKISSSRQYDPSLLIKPVFTISEKIQEGIKLLQRTSPLLYAMKKKSIYPHTQGLSVGASQFLRKQIALVILDTNSGEIFQKRVWANDDDINNFSKIGNVPLVSAVANESLNIQPKRWNSFNTYYEIENRPDLIVVANKYLIESKLLGSLPERSSKKYTEIIYAPYSEALAKNDIIESGKKYLNDSVDLAFDDLKAKNVLSKANDGRLVADVITKEFVKSIILIEHIDPDSFNVADDGGKVLTERVLAIIGANQKNAYRYTGSPAGANGLAQFISSTYNKIYVNYPSAKLIKDYNLGMADHINAIKAMVLFFDIHGQEIEKKIVRQDLASQLGITDEMLAAAYNGGPNRVVTAINKFGLAWLDVQSDLPASKRSFRSETLNYLKKLKSIKDLDLF